MALDCKRTDSRKLAQLEDGVPMDSWQPIELRYYNPRGKKPDIYRISLDNVFSESQCRLLGPVLESSGQLLPISIRERSEKYFLFHCTDVRRAVNRKGSVFIHYADEDDGDDEIHVPAF